MKFVLFAPLLLVSFGALALTAHQQNSIFSDEMALTKKSTPILVNINNIVSPDGSSLIAEIYFCPVSGSCVRGLRSVPLKAGTRKVYQAPSMDLSANINGKLLFKLYRYLPLLPNQHLASVTLNVSGDFVNQVLFSGNGRSVRAINSKSGHAVSFTIAFGATKNNFSPQNSVELTSRKLPVKFRKLLSMDSGVYEGYTLKEHDLRVLSNYNRYGNCYVGHDRDRFMHDVLILHDIGKPLAVQQGRKDDQHRFIAPLMNEGMQKLGYAKKEINLALTLMDNDVLGELGKGMITVIKAVTQMRKLANKAGLPLAEYYALQKAYFVSDAGSYPFLTENVFELVRRSDGKSCLDMKADSYHALETQLGLR